MNAIFSLSTRQNCAGGYVLRERNPILRADEGQLTDDLQINLEGRGPVNNFDGGPVSINLEGHLKPQVGFIPPSGSMATLHPGTRDSRSNTTWVPAAPPVRWRSAALGRRMRTSWQVLPRHQTKAGLSTQRMGVSTSKMATPTSSQCSVSALSEYSKTITPPLIPHPCSLRRCQKMHCAAGSVPPTHENETLQVLGAV